MLEKFAQDEKLEQMAANKRRMRQIQHRREVDELIRQRREAYEAELSAEHDRRAQEREFEAYRAAIIEEERQRLIKEHASKLLGYLPKGVLKDANDVNLLPEDLRSGFKPKPKPYGSSGPAPPWATSSAASRPAASALASSEGNFLAHPVAAHSPYQTTNQANFAPPPQAAAGRRPAHAAPDYRNRPFHL